MNRKLAKNSKRLFGFNREAKTEHELIKGYVDTLENGNLLVFCGGSIGGFNREL